MATDVAKPALEPRQEATGPERPLPAPPLSSPGPAHQALRAGGHRQWGGDRLDGDTGERLPRKRAGIGVWVQCHRVCNDRKRFFVLFLTSSWLQIKGAFSYRRQWGGAAALSGPGTAAPRPAVTAGGRPACTASGVLRSSEGRCTLWHRPSLVGGQWPVWDSCHHGPGREQNSLPGRRFLKDTNQPQPHWPDATSARAPFPAHTSLVCSCQSPYKSASDTGRGGTAPPSSCFAGA